MRIPSHVLAVDDAPFDRAHRGDVPIVGCVYAGTALEGVLVSKVRRDGRNATEAIARMATGSRFAPQLQVVMLQGIALAGFNVVDLERLRALTGCAVLVVARKRPNLLAIRDALLTKVPGGMRKWRLVEQAGAMENVAGVWVQRSGIGLETAEVLIRRLAVKGAIPEPLRTAHLIAGAMATGESRGRA